MMIMSTLLVLQLLWVCCTLPNSQLMASMVSLLPLPTPSPPAIFWLSLPNDLACAMRGSGGDTCEYVESLLE